eukprot:1116586-Pyramimonas_sp.AAC.1
MRDAQGRVQRTQGVHGRAVRGGAQEGFPCEGSRGVREQGNEHLAASSLSCSELLRETPANKQCDSEDVSSEISNCSRIPQARQTLI